MSAVYKSFRPKRLSELPGAICVVSGDRSTYPQFAGNLTTLIRPKETDLVWLMAGGGELAATRNRVVQIALDRGAQWLLLVDDDHSFPPELLANLIRHDRDVVMPMVCKRVPPHEWVAWQPFDVSPDLNDVQLGRALVSAPTGPPTKTSGLVEMGLAGTGCVLVRAEIFRKLEPPWFEFGKFGRSHGGGEDTWFFLRARRAGFRLWCDCDTRIGHLASVHVMPTVDANGQVSYEYICGHSDNNRVSFK